MKVNSLELKKYYEYFILNNCFKKHILFNIRFYLKNKNKININKKIGFSELTRIEQNYVKGKICLELLKEKIKEGYKLIKIENNFYLT